MKRYLFILGRKSRLAYFELNTVLNRLYTKNKITVEKFLHCVIVESNIELNAKQLIAILGGTVKIARLGMPTDEAKLTQHLLEIFRNESIGRTKIPFGISFINSPDTSLYFSIPKKIKKLLSQESISARYLIAKEKGELTSAQVSLGELTEINLIWKKEKIEVGKTIAVQDFKNYSKRDYSRPYSTPRKGMLPPKVARMMINLAIPTGSKQGIWLLDPFCGTGTIAIEALMLGLNTISSDISPSQVTGTKQNLNWLCNQEEIKTKWLVYNSDAVKISQLLKRKIDCIVTEPYLGPLNISQSKVKNIIKGLNKLYLGALKDWNKCLRHKGRLVIALPQFNFGYSSSNKQIANLIIDRRENLGYTLVAGPLLYEREGAQVQRQIYILEKIKA